MTAGRPLEFNPEIALDSAMRLFWVKGFEATSLRDLIITMGLSKSSFYQCFKSKRTLFEQCLHQYRENLINQFSIDLDNETSARHFIESIFNNMLAETCGDDARRGCLLMNTANEFAQTDTQIAGIVSESIEKITTTFEKAIVRGQNEGEISPQKDARGLALYLVSNLSGLKNMIKAGADRETIKRINKITLLALD